MRNPDIYQWLMASELFYKGLRHKDNLISRTICNLCKISFIRIFLLLFLNESNLHLFYSPFHKNYHFILFQFIFKDFYLFIWQWESAQAGGVAGRGGGRSRLPTEQRALCGAPSQDPGIMIWAKGRYLIDWATRHPSNSFLKTNILGHLGGSVVEHLPLAQVVIPGSWDWVCIRLPIGSLLLPLPKSLPLSVSLINK